MFSSIHDNIVLLFSWLIAVTAAFNFCGVSSFFSSLRINFHRLRNTLCRNLFCSFTKYTLSQNTSLQFRVKVLLIWLLPTDILTRGSSSFTEKKQLHNKTPKETEHCFHQFKDKTTLLQPAQNSTQPFRTFWPFTLSALLHKFMSMTIEHFLLCFKPTWERSFLLKIHAARNSLLHLSEKC